MTAKENYQLWLEKVTDEDVKKGLIAMANDPERIENCFYKDLEFGTGGLRGELGAGSNCLNVYTIRKVTQGIADSMKYYGMKTACCSCDSRNYSDVFKTTVAEVFAENGIKTYITKELMPTPFLSYITRYYKADTGVMITASHNPARYNGYKVYGSDGCQLTDNAANELTGYIENVDAFEVKTKDLQYYIAEGLVEYVADDVIEKYLQTVFSQHIGFADGLNVTYSALNGTGYKLVPEMLKRMHVKNLCLVDEQCHPDGNFPTCSYPNPEKAEALALGIETAKKNGSDILIATDPDADRVGTAVLHDGKYVLLTGNEVGVLLTDYLLTRKKENGTLPVRPVIVKTIVTTDLVRKVAAPYNVEIFDVLTGFKYIGDVIAKLERKGEEGRYVLGFEESYGYLSGTYVRDKDAVNASMLVAEMTAYYKNKNMTLVDRLNRIYAEHGYYEHKLMSFDFPGADGQAKLKRLLANIRKNLPESIAGSKVVKFVDYLTQTEADLPKSNVLSFTMEDASKLIIRPSGTEPMVKMYLTATRTEEENQKKFSAMKTELEKMFDRK
ncbi:MAG: phospho-sugar mutase [Firmicutes bacterium]|nr:phospho-sugar mutase [Bacillota bacterium]MDY5532021.1 phospho-sugar mutase [Pumilibacteraceae bacterium]